MKYYCPCCGYFVYDYKAAAKFGICPICYWENDPVQKADINLEGGANELSLKKARDNYKNIGASDAKYLDSVRAPKPTEKKADIC